MEKANAADWNVGSHVVARGEPWVVTGRTSFHDCDAVCLRAQADGRERTLLAPFDRIRARPAVAGFRAVRVRRWFHHLRDLRMGAFPFAGLQSCPEGLDLLPYQLEPALAALRYGHRRLLIADEVGLGKTIQAGLILSELAAADAGCRALVLAPAGLGDQWAGELSGRFGVQAARADSAWLRASARALPAGMNPWSLEGIYLASFDFVKRPEALRPLEDVTWDLVVVDEAHAAAAGTDRRAAVHAVAGRARRVVLLTATPHAGDSRQFEALCAIGAHPGGSPVLMFRRTRAETSGASLRRSRLRGVHPSAAEARMHRILEAYTGRVCREATARRESGGRLASIVLRKRALSSAGSLAISVRRRIGLLDLQGPAAVQALLPLDEEDTADDRVPDHLLGAPGLADRRTELALLRAVEAAADEAARDETKMRALAAFLRRLHEPAIVFTEYRDTLDRLHAWLTGSGIPACLLHGGLTLAERRRAVALFERGGRTLLATDAASEGLNLHQACRLVIHYELPWTPSRLEQRAGRVDRHGQSRRVHEVALVAADTAEAMVLGPLARRIANRRAGSHHLLDNLAESHVASAILDGTDLRLDGRPEGTRGGRPRRGDTGRTDETAPGSTPADSPAITGVAALPPPGLAAEARIEAERLGERRRIARGAGSRLARPRRRAGTAVSTLRRPGRAARAVLVYEWRVLDGTGTPLALDLVALGVPLERRWPDPSAAAARRAAAAVIDAAGGITAQIVGRRVQAAVKQISALHESSVGDAIRREREVAGVPRGAARELVQAGLFDRRALRAAAAHRRVRLALDEAAGGRAERLAAARRVTTRVDLRAVLFIEGRRG